MLTAATTEETSPSTTNAAYALTYLKSQTNASDAQIARVLHLTRTSVINRRQGLKPLTLEDIDRLADAFGVPTAVFLMEPAEVRHWLNQNWADWGDNWSDKKYYRTTPLDRVPHGGQTTPSQLPMAA